MPRIDPAHLRLAVRATVAAAIAFLLAWLLDLPKGYWAVLTAILVVQSSIGASLAVAVDRCLGTLAGGGIGVGLAMIAGPSWSLSFALLLLGTFVSAFIAARNPSFKLAPVTVVIVMLADPTHAEPWISGLERVSEIALGGAVGLACALLVLPDKALGYLFPHVADALEASADLLEAGVAGLLDGGLDPARMDVLNQKVRVTLRAADVRAGEARRERVGPFNAAPDPGPIVRGGRRLWHSVIILLRGADRPLPPAVADQVRPALSAASQALAQGVRGIASALRGGGPPPDLAATDAAVAALQAELERLGSSGALAGEGPSLMPLYAAAAGCAYIHDNLIELAARLAEARKDAA